MSITLDIQIEAILFFKAVPIQVGELAHILDVSKYDIFQALDVLEDKLVDRGLQLVHKDNSILISTSKDVSEIIEQITKEDLQKDIGKAGLETLSIILYRGPVTRSEIDYVRGVNSSYILRMLLIRGLIERYTNPQDRRSHVYRPTFELLQYLGVTRLEDLPEYTEVRNQMQEFVDQQQETNENV